MENAEVIASIIIAITLAVGPMLSTIWSRRRAAGRLRMSWVKSPTAR